MQYKFFIVVCFLILFAACAPSRFVKPLDKNQHAVNLSLGGPLIKFRKATIPIPFLTATYGYGIDSSLTAFGSLNITSALFQNLQLEMGLTKQWLKQKCYRPGFSTNPVINFIYHDPKAYKFYPQLDLNAFWEYGEKKNFVYLGLNNWFELSSQRALGVRQQNRWLISPMIGHTFTGEKWNFNVEVKIIAPHLSNQKIVVDYQTPLKNRGAMGVYLGYTRKF